MAITTYSELQTAAANWLQRSDLTSRIPEFIALAEAKFNRGYSEQDPFFAADQELEATASATEYMSLPDNCLDLRTLKVLTSPVRNLDYITPQNYDKKFTTGAVGPPTHYTIVANQIRLGPAPDSAYTVKADYIQSVIPLATTSPNWLLTSHPDVYLYGTLLEATGYANDDARIPIWKSAYDMAVRSLRNKNRKQVFSGSVLQVRPA